MVYSLQEEFEDTKEVIGVIQVVPITTKPHNPNPKE